MLKKSIIKDFILLCGILEDKLKFVECGIIIMINQMPSSMFLILLIRKDFNLLSKLFSLLLVLINYKDVQYLFLQIKLMFQECQPLKSFKYLGFIKPEGNGMFNQHVLLRDKVLCKDFNGLGIH